MQTGDFESDVTLLRILREAGAPEVSNEAAAEFHARYMQRLMALVDRNLAQRYRSRLDPDDLVQSIFRTWFRRAGDGRIQPSTQDEVWKLLSVVALNRVRRRISFHDAQRRRVQRTRADAAVLDAIPEPTVEDATEFLDQIEAAGKRMSDMAQRTLEMILDDKSVDEIASELGRTTRSVSRYKTEIGRVLRSMLDDEVTRP